MKTMKHTSLDLVAALAVGAVLAGCGVTVDAPSAADPSGTSATPTVPAVPSANAHPATEKATYPGPTAYIAYFNETLAPGERRSLCQYVDVGGMDARTISHAVNDLGRSVVLQRATLPEDAAPSLGATFDCGRVASESAGGVLYASTDSKGTRDFGAYGAVQFRPGDVALVRVDLENTGSKGAAGTAILDFQLATAKVEVAFDAFAVSFGAQGGLRTITCAGAPGVTIGSVAAIAAGARVDVEFDRPGSDAEPMLRSSGVEHALTEQFETGFVLGASDSIRATCAPLTEGASDCTVSFLYPVLGGAGVDTSGWCTAR